EVYGIKPFGQNISFGQEIDDYKEMGLSSIVIDSTYYKLLISYGLISFVLLLIIYFIGVKKITLKNDKICFLLPYALFAFMETTGIFPLLSFPILLIDDKENNNE